MKPIIKTVWWENKSLYIIDQTKLPLKEKTLRLQTVKQVRDAIRLLKIRGAPAIGVTAAYGVALSCLAVKTNNVNVLCRHIQKDIDYLKTSRPTAYDLFFTLNKMKSIIETYSGQTAGALRNRILKEADKIFKEDLECGRKIGLNGNKLIKNNMNILTHCNAGGLATAGFGTALSVFFAAKKSRKKFRVFVDETRPVLQGARLTAWELEKTGIPYTLICDNMAGSLMAQGKIDMVITGADRIARNGDTANKIGTYSLAVLAKYHKIAFYIAAPFSTFDPNISTGKEIPIEERNPAEIRQIKSVPISPIKAPVYNPAFDVTPARLIHGFITEKGIIRPPFRRFSQKVT